MHSAPLPPPCLLDGLAIYPDLVWSGNISTPLLCWTETDTQPLEALLAFATNLWCKTEEWCLFKTLKNEVVCVCVSTCVHVREGGST